MTKRKPYYYLHEAIYMAKEHGVEFDWDKWSSSDWHVIIHWLQIDVKTGDLEAMNSKKFYVANPEVLNVMEGDMSDGGYYFFKGRWWNEHVFYNDRSVMDINYRNGKPFLQPHYEEE